jgi:ATP-dependent helicase HrpA
MRTYRQMSTNLNLSSNSTNFYRRVIVIAPTRAACETIEIALGLHIDTYLERTHGEQVRELARSGNGFGIIAGTGTGKTLAVRPIAEEILGQSLKVGVVNREREATPELPTWNVVVVTTGIARRWFQDNEISQHDALVVDEIHQTSAELELCLALGKRVGCRFIWLSATVDPTFYKNYLGSTDVLQVYSFDPQKAATVKVVNKEPLEFLDDGFIQMMTRQKRGVGIFLPTRAGTEQAALAVSHRFPRVRAAFYHGGEPISAIRPFLEDTGSQKPYLLAMTAAGQSALNVQGLDTVIIDDTRFTNIIENGRNVLTRLHLGANEILQMAGRVHGRVEGGRVFILSNRDIDFSRLRPTAPEFQLAGDSERVALTCADLGVRADELELPVPLDQVAYRRAFSELQERGIITESGRLTTYGRTVEALPVDRAWAELIVNADKELLPILAVMSSIESLHRMTRDERYIDDLVMAGSDHLTTYNLYAEAFQKAGYIGEVYGLPRQLFDPETLGEWADERGVLVKSIEDAALAMAVVLRGVGVPLPTKMPLANRKIFDKFTDLLAKFMPFDLVINEETADGRLARLSKTSVCNPAGAIAGDLRYFADRFGVPRAFIEGTQLRIEQVRRYAKRGQTEIVYDPFHKKTPLLLKKHVQYFGFELEREVQPILTFSPEIAPQARRVLAEALARYEARHAAVHRNRAAIEEIRELYRRSGGQTPRLGFTELTALYERQLHEQEVNSVEDFQEANLTVHTLDFITQEQREKLHKLPTRVIIEHREVDYDYDVEEHPATVDENGIELPATKIGVIRLRLPEKLAHSITEEQLPKFDRPIRFVVSRGSRGAIRAASLAELQMLIEGPWTPNTSYVESHATSEAQKKQKRAIASHVKATHKKSGGHHGARKGGRRR